MTGHVDPGPEPVLALHVHNNPVTGAAALSASWPCPQCIALGRTEPLTYASDGGTVADDGGMSPTPIPPKRLEAYLASFPAAARPEPGPPGGHRARRKARREAERQTRRGNR